MKKVESLFFVVVFVFEKKGGHVLNRVGGSLFGDCVHSLQHNWHHRLLQILSRRQVVNRAFLLSSKLGASNFSDISFTS